MSADYVHAKALEREIQHIKELMAQHNRMMQLAIDKAEGTMNERLAKMNEFRAQQADIITKFATMERLESVLSNINIQIESIKKENEELKLWRSNMQGRYAIIVILWPVLLLLIEHFLKL